jgi:putative flippase GtrA
MFAKAAALYGNAQFVTFVVVSGLAAMVNILARAGFSLFFSFGVAVALAYPVAMTVAFLLNRKYVFPNSTKSLSHNITFFVLVNAAAFPLVWIVSWVLGDLLLPSVMGPAPSEAIGHTVGVMSPAFSNFALHKFLTFRSVDAR